MRPAWKVIPPPPRPPPPPVVQSNGEKPNLLLVLPEFGRGFGAGSVLGRGRGFLLDADVGRQTK
jgi:hypothetical protein